MTTEVNSPVLDDAEYAVYEQARNIAEELLQEAVDKVHEKLAEAGLPAEALVDAMRSQFVTAYFYSNADHLCEDHIKADLICSVLEELEQVEEIEKELQADDAAKAEGTH